MGPRKNHHHRITAFADVISTLAGAIFFITIFVSAAPARCDSALPVAKTGLGEVHGVVRGNVREFLGIPYAAPPVGALRWQPPKPHEAWTGILDTSHPGHDCPQMRFLHRGMEGSEDCLYLNVYSPDPTPEALPVMVWIHGGTFVAGAGAWFPARNLAARGRLVVVTINYRLGALGFLANRSLDASEPQRISSNYGLLDQQAALRWVRESIAAFGGDPHRVTIAGESAGAISIGLQLVSPGAAGLFDRGIIESGPFLGPLHHTRTLAEAEERGDRFAAKLGCDKAADVAKCLRAKTTEEVLNAIPAHLLEAGELPWAPIVDGHVIPQQPAEAIAAGHFNKAPIINGSNRDEGTLFTAFSKPITAEQYQRAVNAQAGKYAGTLLAAYPASAYPSPAQAAAAALGDINFSCRVVKASEMLSASVPVYEYEFDDPEAPNLSYPGARFPLGAYHSAEIQYVFGSLEPRSVSKAQRDLSDRMIDYWTDFISFREPWQRFDASAPKILSLAPDAIGYESDYRKAHHCALWDSIR